MISILINYFFTPRHLGLLVVTGSILFFETTLLYSKPAIPMPGEVAGNLVTSIDQEKTEYSHSRLFNWYQEISKKSISRCPFKTSCSRFAETAIRKHGLFKGAIMSIDRYFYRENIAASFLYHKYQRNGKVLINDDYYLYGKLK